METNNELFTICQWQSCMNNARNRYEDQGYPFFYIEWSIQSMENLMKDVMNACDWSK